MTLAAAEGQALIDAAGRSHAPAPDARILSLVPSLTETVFALGLGGQIAGRTTYCVHPAPEVEQALSVGGTKKVNWRKVEETGATHALLNIDENPKDMADELSQRGIIPVVTHPIEAADNGPLIRFLGGLFARPEPAAALADRFERALRSFQSEAPAQPRRVLYLIWKDPWMTVSEDTYISKFLALAGWRTLAGRADVRYPEIELTEDLLTETDAVLFSSEPYAFGSTDLTAFRAAYPAHAEKARLVDGELLSWYGVRAIGGLEYLRRLASGGVA